MIPTETLYRIFDNLDTETIVFSIQCVCKRLYAVANTYQKYKLQLKFISQHKFYMVCRAIRPDNVISLILSDGNKTPGQIRLFFSLFRIQDYTRLQTITLILITEVDLKTILEHMTTLNSLISLSITFDENSSYSTEIVHLLSSVIGRRSLRKLDLTMEDKMINDLVWPVECSFQHLRLFNSVDIEQLCTILHCSSHLKTISIRDCIISNLTQLESIVSNGTRYPQVTSLTLEDIQTDMEMIKLLLSLTPSLVHLKLIGHGTALFNGSHWEQFIKAKLPALDRFEFMIHKNVDVSLDSDDLESLIAPFRTPFWLETKHWHVTCVDIRQCLVVNLHSIPVCASKVDYYPKSYKISCSTAPALDCDSKKMDNIRQLRINLSEMMAHDAIEQVRIKKNEQTNFGLQLYL
ncbi:unnamed protein product [Rotaria sp. Silwood1]|nr:unnamed protein product [Rotaria sp. Silwood1]